MANNPHHRRSYMVSPADWFDPVLRFANAKDLRQSLLGEESLKWQVGPWRFADDGDGKQQIREWLLLAPPDECWNWEHLDGVSEDQLKLRNMLAVLEKHGRATPKLWKELSQG
ncbi:MAG: hypothetical protein KDI31_15775, partial [Pseudomonadales bacterium]|nr:hypothetical protein [Pseudomonadales bacterium]